MPERNVTLPTTKRSFVLDTCVLIADPQALLRFDEHDVVLPLVVIEELDRQKSRMDEVGANARSAIRLLEEMGASRSGGLAVPHGLPGGGTIRIELNCIQSERLPVVLNPTTPDHRILATCLNLHDEGSDTVLVTKDAALRIKGAQLGIDVEDYRGDTVQVDESYSGVLEVEVDTDVIDEMYASGKAEIPFLEGIINQYLILKGPGSASALARVAEDGPDPVAVRVPGSRHMFGIETKNVRQAFAADLLLDPEVSAVSLMGMAGTGKTFLSLAAGLEQVVEMGRYRRVSVYRPLIAVGRQEIGFLPGDLNDKLEPWMAAVHDNLYALFGSNGSNPRDMVDELFERDVLEMAAVTYLRGRSITDELVIVDEAQNLELPTLKVILTRMASNSKVVFCGDLTQVDNPYISPFGGLSALIEKFKGNPMFGHITMERTVRSPLAELATQLL
ncbi:MAG: PhoH family protein [Actinomycetota bacterium]